MAPSVTLTVAPSTPKSGDTVTATYKVSGNDGTPAGPGATGTLVGDVMIGTTLIRATTELTLPGTPAVPPLDVVYAPPVMAGLAFKSTSNIAVFTALVP